jgi:POT family proton-dependent oligopeptide transporter
VPLNFLSFSPIGISFVSRVAPPKYKGLMQGGWFAATAIGNYLLSVMAWFWMRVPLWGVWLILIGCCLLSAAFIFSILKRLERLAKA